MLRGSRSLRRSLEQLVRSSPAGPPLQGTELVALRAPEASLARLVPLRGHMAVWESLPSVLHGVLPRAGSGLVFLADDVGLRTIVLGDFSYESPDGVAQDLRGQAPLGKSGIHRITRCPSLLSALRRSICQPCRCSRAQRSPASASLSYCPET